MTSVDSRILTMKFDNTQFTRGVTQTMSMLDRLKAALNFGGIKNGIGSLGSSIGGLFGRLGAKLNPFKTAQKGVQDLQASTNRFSMGTMTGQVTSVSKSFLAMSTVAITALANIANRAVNAGLNLVKSLTISPVMDGFREYETNLNSIQTILANTGLKGKAGLDQVTGALNELNTYADKTIYNFSEMARNIGTFTAAGVDLKTATASIKGIANLAALSGSNSQQASTAMYQLSQAISSGRVGLQDWNSVVNAGMGGKVFQTALARTASVMGTLGENSVKSSGKMKRLTIDGKSFRESITAKPGQKSWLTSDVLTETLKQFGGNMTRAQLKAEGFKKAQIDAIIEMGKTGTDAATKVKTLSQLMGTLKEAVGSGWAKSFAIIFGNFTQAKTLFTSVSNTLGGLISSSANARNNMLKDWAKMGGRTAIIDSIRNAFNALLSIIRPIKAAFQDIFPPMTGARLADLSKNLRDFTSHLKLSDDASNNLKRTFRGVFAVFDILGQAVGAAVGMFFDLFGAVGQGAGSFLDFTGGIGDFLVSIDEAIRKGDVFGKIFDTLGAVLKLPITLLGSLGSLLAGLFDGIGSSDALDKATSRLAPLATAGEKVRAVFAGLGDFVSNVASKIGEAFGGIGDAIANSMTAESFGSVLDTINTGLFAAIVLMIKRFVAGGVKVNVGEGLFSKVKGSLDAVTETLKGMQTQIKSDAILKIAAAMGILAASLVALALIDPRRLAAAMAAMAAGFAGLQFALVSLNAALGVIGAAKLVVISAALIGLGVAMVIFSGALKILASMSLGEMVKGLGGMAAMLVLLSLAVQPLSANAGGMIRAGLGLIAVALALKIMASALQDFADLSWADMGKGLAGVAGSLVILAGAMQIMPKNIFVTAAGLLVLGAALQVIAGAVQSFANIGWGAMVQGFTGIAVALGLLAVAMRLMPTNMLLQAAALLILGGALNAIGLAVASMGGLSMETIAKGLLTLAGSLAILAVALNLMSGTLAGAAALVVAAGALMLLTPVLISLGAMSWGMIVKGLVTMAAALTIIGVAGYLIGPVVPLLIGLGAAIVLMGAGLALAGVAALAFSTAFSILVAAVIVGVRALLAVGAAILNFAKNSVTAIAQAVIRIAKGIGAAAPAFFAAMGKVINGLLNVVIKAIPRLGKLFLTMLNTALRVVVTAIPRIVNAGYRLIIGFMNVISRNVPRIIRIAADIIVKFLNGISRALPRIMNAGTTLIVRFLNGISRNVGRLVTAGTTAVVKFINGVANNIGRVINAGINLAIKFVNGVANGLRGHQAAMNSAGRNLAGAIVSGMVSGIASGLGSVISAAQRLASSALSAAKHALGINSPSKEFAKVGMGTAEGMRDGINTYSHIVDKASENMGKSALSKMKATMSGLSTAMDNDTNWKPVISPVLDLSQVHTGARGVNDIFAKQKMTAELSTARATTLSADALERLAAATPRAEEGVVKEIKFEQHNHSPKALDPVTIYRQTRNQFSLAKEALDPNGRN